MSKDNKGRKSKPPRRVRIVQLLLGSIWIFASIYMIVCFFKWIGIYGYISRNNPVLVMGYNSWIHLFALPVLHFGLNTKNVRNQRMKYKIFLVLNSLFLIGMLISSCLLIFKGLGDTHKRQWEQNPLNQLMSIAYFLQALILEIMVGIIVKDKIIVINNDDSNQGHPIVTTMDAYNLERVDVKKSFRPPRPPPSSPEALKRQITAKQTGPQERVYEYEEVKVSRQPRVEKPPLPKHILRPTTLPPDPPYPSSKDKKKQSPPPRPPPPGLMVDPQPPPPGIVIPLSYKETMV